MLAVSARVRPRNAYLLKLSVKKLRPPAEGLGSTDAHGPAVRENEVIKKWHIELSRITPQLFRDRECGLVRDVSRSRMDARDDEPLCADLPSMLHYVHQSTKDVSNAPVRQWEGIQQAKTVVYVQK